MRPRETALVAGARAARGAAQPLVRARRGAASSCCRSALSLLGLAGAERSGLAGFDRTTASLLNLALLFVPLVTLVARRPGHRRRARGRVARHAPRAAGHARWRCTSASSSACSPAVSASISPASAPPASSSASPPGGGNARAFVALVARHAPPRGCDARPSARCSRSLLRTRARVVGAAFAVWLLLVYVSDLGTIGLVVARSLRPGQVFVLALLNPVQQARVLGTLALSDRLEVLGPVGVFGLDHFGATGLAGPSGGGAGGDGDRGARRRLRALSQDGDSMKALLAAAATGARGRHRRGRLPLAGATRRARADRLRARRLRALPHAHQPARLRRRDCATAMER